MSTSLDSCRALVEDLRGARTSRYYADAGLSAVVGWGLAAAALHSSSLLPASFAFLFASLLLYRALAFIHELFHQQQLRIFRCMWHILVGVPLLLPLLLYLPIHQGHHSSSSYGTTRDGEYEQFFGRSLFMTWRLLLLNLALPVALWIRFGLLTPLGMLVPAVRLKVTPSFVHLSLRMPYKAPHIRGAAAKEAKWVELACMLWAWGLLSFVFIGYAQVAAIWAMLLIAIGMLNTVRALCSTHLYVEHPEARDALHQVADSLNIEGGGLLTQLLCPVGLQYHALHHLAPYLPYHALPEAHQRLMQALPTGSVYHQATVRSLFEGWGRLVQATEANPSPCPSRSRD